MTKPMSVEERADQLIRRWYGNGTTGTVSTKYRDAIIAMIQEALAERDEEWKEVLGPALLPRRVESPMDAIAVIHENAKQAKQEGAREQRDADLDLVLGSGCADILDRKKIREAWEDKYGS